VCIHRVHNRAKICMCVCVCVCGCFFGALWPNFLSYFVVVCLSKIFLSKDNIFGIVMHSVRCIV